jgi:hypothetical protein
VNRNRQALRNWATRRGAPRFGRAKNRCDRKSPLLAARPIAGLGVWLALALGVCARPAVAQLASSPAEQLSEKITWKTGPALERELEAPLSLLWTERQSRDALNSLSRSTSVALFLDRRLDPSQPLNLTVREEPLKAVVARVADELGGSVSLVGPVVYIGPRGNGGLLAALASQRRQSIGSLPRDAQQALLKSAAWRWDELSEPRSLLEALAAEADVRVVNPELLPHDLWPAADLPAMPWVERMTILLAGFDLSFELNPEGRAIRLVPIPADLAFERVYSLAGDQASHLRELVPGAKISVARGQLRAIATVAQHEQIARVLAANKATPEAMATPSSASVPPKADPAKRYTVTVQNQPAGSVVATVARQLGLQARYEREIGERLTRKISLSVKDVPLDDLLEKSLAPLGLAWRIEGEQLLIESAANQ